MDDKLVISVLDLNTYVSDRMYQDPFLEEVWVQGEVSGFDVKHDTAYFTLTDGQASVDCMIFEYGQSGFDEMEMEGSAVMLNGDISIYRKNGRFRIVVRALLPAGVGDMFLNFNKLKEQLEKQGVFAPERKKKIPGYPEKIGIVTSREGAALRDIINVAKRRNPLIALTLYPVRVQGISAPREIAAGIDYLNANTDADVIIVGRGGGSAEDLYAFNDERVVLAIFDSQIPVISAVGHETDFTLADLAADLRAPTPSAAAELAVPVMDDLILRFTELKRDIRRQMDNALVRSRAELIRYRAALSKESILQKMARYTADVRSLRAECRHGTDAVMQKRAVDLDKYIASMASMNPEEVFARGYSVILKNGKAVKSIRQLAAGDAIEVSLADGAAYAHIDKTEERGNGFGKGH